MSKLTANAEDFLWNNFKFYLMTHKTCLCDNLLEIVNASSDDPFTRYNDFNNELNKHIGLGSYTIGQAAQFSALPYITVNINVDDLDNCTARVIMTFDVTWGNDTPAKTPDTNNGVGNSSESVARFRANICNSLNKIMYEAYDDTDKHYESRSFFDALKNTAWVNPATKTGDPVQWKYNIVGSVNDNNEVSNVIQLKREDRSSGVTTFDVAYFIDINRLYGSGIDCGC